MAPATITSSPPIGSVPDVRGRRPWRGRFGVLLLGVVGPAVVLAGVASLPSHRVVWYLAFIALPISFLSLARLLPARDRSQWVAPTRLGIAATVLCTLVTLLCLASVPFDGALRLRIRATEQAMDADGDSVLSRARALPPDPTGLVRFDDVGTIGTYRVFGPVVVDPLLRTVRFTVATGGVLLYAPHGLDCTTIRSGAEPDCGTHLEGAWYQGKPTRFMEQG